MSCHASAERLAVADELAADVAQGVLGAAALELVDRDDVGEVEHVDLLELRGGAELRRHHVQREVDERHDRRRRPGRCRASRRSTRSKPAALQHGDHVGEVLGQLAAAPRVASDRKKTRSPVRGEFIRIRSPSSAPPPRRRVGSTASTAMRSLSSWSTPEPADQLVGQRRLARAAGAGDAEHRDRLAAAAEVEPLRQAAGSRRAVMRAGQRSAGSPVRSAVERRRRRRRGRRRTPRPSG